jgi:tetratricopeptide (TPR) repeat protein
MTGRHPPPVGGRTPIDELRDDLSKAEIWIVQLGVGGRSALPGGVKQPLNGQSVDGIALLQLFDRIADRMDLLEQKGADLRAERGRFESLQKQFRRRGAALVARIGDALVRERPSEARWWWYIQEQINADRKRRLLRMAKFALAGLVLLAVLYLLYDRFLAPPPRVRQANAAFYEGERAVNAGEFPEAIEQFETAVGLDPESVDAHLWLGILYQSTGQQDKATLAFERARSFFDTDYQFLLERGLGYLELADFDAAQAGAEAIIQLEPERPEGYFLLGSTAERMGDLEVALEAFQRASDLADASNQPALQVTARMHIAAILERFGTEP